MIISSNERYLSCAYYIKQYIIFQILIQFVNLVVQQRTYKYFEREFGIRNTLCNMYLLAKA